MEPSGSDNHRWIMQIGSRFTIAVHVVTAIEYFKDEGRVTSEFLAGSIGVNPVIVRSVIAQLREANILKTRRGSGGAKIARPLDQITLLDLLEAVGGIGEGGLFRFHEQPNPDCPVGRNIHQALDGHLTAAQRAMEDSLRGTTLADVVGDTRRAVDSEGDKERSTT